ncbi:hypothetical protein [Streptomyces qinglanensis]|uniref:hypothetical protein n=1 Tax=Streptomyces qinglanensis TaxID=943816 RepID=UPI00085BBAC0|nr:hypothetical protein [Streptomyces qinglanensis]
MHKRGLRQRIRPRAAGGPAAPEHDNPPGHDGPGPEHDRPGPGGGEAAEQAAYEAAERARRGRRRLLVAGALFATLILPRVVSPPGSADGTETAPPGSGPGSTTASAGPHPGAGRSPSPAPAPGATGPGRSDAPHPPASPAPGGTGPAAGPGSGGDEAAFRSVRAGQCLTVHGNGTGWNRPAPTEATRIGCGDDRAFTRVTAVRHAPADGAGDPACPTGNGRATWTHGTTTLCLTRQFRTGQCLLAEADDGRMRAALMSAPACSSVPPSGQGRYDRLLRVTGVREDTAPCRENDPAAHSRYWRWRIDGGGRTLCTADATE